MKSLKRSIRQLVVIIAFVTIWTQTLYAQPTESRIRDAVSSISRDEYRQAIETLNMVIKDNPSSSLTWYYLGFSYNRLGFYKEACNSLIEAAILGMQTPELYRELGIAFSGQQKYQKAWEYLLKAKPDDTQAAYMRGFVAIKLGMIEEAKKELRTAGTDPLYRNKTENLLTELDRSPVKKQKKARFSVTAGGLYSDNVSLRPDEAISVPGEHKDMNDYAFSWDVDGSYLLMDKNNTQLDLFLNVFETYYRDLTLFDTTGLTTGIEARYTLPEWRAWIRPTFFQEWLGWDSYLSSFALPLGGEIRGPKLFGLLTTLRKTYTYCNNTYHFGSVGKERLDGHVHRFTLGPTFSTPDRKINFSVGMSSDIRETKGTSMRYNALGLLVGCDVWLLPMLNVRTSYTYREPHYKNANIRSALGRKRKDSENIFSVSTSLWIRQNQELNFYYQFLDNRSNIPVFFEYDQNTYGLYYRYYF